MHEVRQGGSGAEWNAASKEQICLRRKQNKLLGRKQENAGEQSYVIFLNKAEGMANTKSPHTGTGKRQNPTKKNRSIMLFFQRQNQKQVTGVFPLQLLRPVKS